MSIRRATRAVVGTLVIAAATAALGGVPAAANTNPSIATLQTECPTVMPLSEVSTGMRGWALSVTSGRNAVLFNVEVLGILRDAVGPGRDIIIANLSGNAVTAAGGLWFGASGSPVFFRNGLTGKYEVAGAIAYGLAGGGSTLAGLTPAQDMDDVISGAGGVGLASEKKVAVPLKLATRIAGATGLSVAESGSLERLKMPLSASGLTSRGLQRMRDAVARERVPFFPYMGSSATSNPPVPTGKLRAGESIAAALSLGDVTIGGIGTTTWVCEGRVVGFGHPFSWTGETNLAARAADTITIVRDTIFGSYKLANIAESVGTITQDRLAGIGGEIGVGPDTFPISSTVTDLETGRSRTGSTHVVDPEFVPFLSFMHLFTNIDVTIDRIGPGNSEIAFAISGVREDGAPWTLERTNHYASSFDISFDSVFEVANAAEVLGSFTAEEVRITDVAVSRLDVAKAYEHYRISKVLVWNGRKYAASGRTVQVKAGALVRLRVVLKPQHRKGTENLDVAIRAPKGKNRVGLLEIFGGESFPSEVCFFCEEDFEGDEGDDEAEPLTFDEVLTALRTQPRGDDLVARMRFGSRGATLAKVTNRLDAVVSGGKTFVVVVRK